MMAGRAPAARNQAMPQLFTVGEVGDHRSADDLWLLVDADGGGYDVYDATGEYIALDAFCCSVPGTWHDVWPV